MPCYLNSDKLFLALSDLYHSPERDSILAPKAFSLLEFEIAPARPTKPVLLAIIIVQKLDVSNSSVEVSVQFWYHYHGHFLGIVKLRVDRGVVAT